MNLRLDAIDVARPLTAAGPFIREDFYSTSLDCSIAAGIFATDISERAT
jgi:hypothetical protein